MHSRIDNELAILPDVREDFCEVAVQIELDYEPVDVRSSPPPLLDPGIFGWTAGSETPEFTRSQVIDEVLKVRDEERQRIGQELHDSAGQLLVSLQLSVAHLGDVGEQRAYEMIVEEIHDTVRQIDREIRSLAFLNYPVEMQQRTLPVALELLARGFTKRTGLRLRFKTAGDVSAADGPTSTALLRVAQEALVNIHRHSHASSVGVSLKAGNHNLDLTVSDDGVGMPAGEELEKIQGVGLKGMRYRIEHLGGSFRIKKSKKGTIVSASVPLAA